MQRPCPALLQISLFAALLQLAHPAIVMKAEEL
jgi:hypothetical protein